MHQPCSSGKTVRKTPGRVLDTIPTQSKTPLIRHMGRMDQEKTQRRFSWINTGSTDIRANSVAGFEVALDGILLVYSLVTLELVER
ncbi:hypothetical protein LG52_3285 [Geobacillus kaustophilus]|uniref:Uncharacterized protein n=1 Tax=Geobacillus kaustophilus TaxID=1462 RepID=A0A0D8BQA7_GEOKU|nr:hypothetical protein LG52_3285 [Geobacillus kaustophilus]